MIHPNSHIFFLDRGFIHYFISFWHPRCPKCMSFRNQKKTQNWNSMKFPLVRTLKYYDYTKIHLYLFLYRGFIHSFISVRHPFGSQDLQNSLASETKKRPKTEIQWNFLTYVPQNIRNCRFVFKINDPRTPKQVPKLKSNEISSRTYPKILPWLLL